MIEPILCLTNGLLILWVVVLKLQLEQVRREGVPATAPAPTSSSPDPDGVVASRRGATKGSRSFSITG